MSKAAPGPGPDVPPSVRDLVRRAFTRFPSRVALVTDRVSFTFAELEDRTLRLAAAIEDRGVGPSDVVAYVLSPRPEELYEVRLATYETGSTLFGVPPMLSPGDLATLLARVRPRLVVHDPSLAPHVSEVARSVLPGAALIPSGGPAGDYHGLLASTPPRRGSNPIDPDSLTGLGFTSGTTGTPKGVTATHRAVADSCLRLLDLIDRVASPEVAEGFLTGIPIFAAGSGFVVPALALGMTNHVPDRFDAMRALDLVEAGRASFAFLTPSQLMDLLDTPLEERDLTALKMVVYGSASLPAANVAEAVRRLGPVLLQGYGMSECPPPVTVLSIEDHGTRERPASPDVLSSAGFPAEGVRVMIEAEDGRALAALEIGEVLVSSPAITAGYFGDPGRTAQARRVAGASADVARYDVDGRLHVSVAPPGDPSHGWWRSGDMGFLDGAGRLHVLERKQDILRRNGRLLYPRVIEEAVAEHPSVKEVCAVQLPGAETIVAAVSLRARLRGVTRPDAFARELLAFLSSRLLPHERPDEVRVFPELPRSVQGKVLKREVRNALASRGI